jgi:large exoprotein involved in heme utilization and adhesion
MNRSRITTSVAGGTGDGGNIGITGADYIILNKSGIIAQAYEGRGGNIGIQAEQFVKTPESIVDASSRLGIDGDVSVDAPENDIGSIVIKPENSFMDTPELIRDPCRKEDITSGSGRSAKKRAVSSITWGLRDRLPFDFSFPYSFFNVSDLNAHDSKISEINGKTRGEK